MMKKKSIIFISSFIFIFSIYAFLTTCTNIFSANFYDVVINHGTVFDPETKLQAVRNVGIQNGIIQTITTNSIKGKKIIDASDLVVSPGFINLNVHTMDNETFKLLAREGITTALELEGGTVNIAEYYNNLKDTSYLNYGASVGHMPVRMEIFQNPPSKIIASGKAAIKQASKEELINIINQINRGLKQGGLGVGFALAYTGGASSFEILEIFRLAARYRSPVFVHMRYSGNRSVEGLMEIIAGSAISGAQLHVNHITSTGGKFSSRLLQMMVDANAHGLKISTELYPYTRGMTSINASFFKLENNKYLLQNIDFKNFIHVETGQKLNVNNFFETQKKGGWVIFGNMSKQIIDQAISHPLVMIASDTIIINGKGHPRNVGSFAKTFRYYVREKKILTLMQAIEKMTLMPAKVLEIRAPSMKKRGRLQVGAYADITIFDPNTITDTATYSFPSSPSKGIFYLLINGVLLIENEIFQSSIYPGKPIRAPH